MSVNRKIKVNGLLINRHIMFTEYGDYSASSIGALAVDGVTDEEP